jgi:hypothetical protein
MTILSGCALQPVANPVILEPVSSTVVISPDLLADCVAMKPLIMDSYTELQLLQQVQLWSTDFNNCRLNHKALSGITKKAFNIK